MISTQRAATMTLVEQRRILVQAVQVLRELHDGYRGSSISRGEIDSARIALAWLLEIPEFRQERTATKAPRRATDFDLDRKHERYLHDR